MWRSRRSLSSKLGAEVVRRVADAGKGILARETSEDENGIGSFIEDGGDGARVGEVMVAEAFVGPAGGGDEVLEDDGLAGGRVGEGDEVGAAAVVGLGVIEGVVVGGGEGTDRGFDAVAMVRLPSAFALHFANLA